QSLRSTIAGRSGTARPGGAGSPSATAFPARSSWAAAQPGSLSPLGLAWNAVQKPLIWEFPPQPAWWSAMERLVAAGENMPAGGRQACQGRLEAGAATPSGHPRASQPPPGAGDAEGPLARPEPV